MSFNPSNTSTEPILTLLTNRIKTIFHHPNLPIRILGLHNGTIVIMHKSEILQTFSNSPAPIRSIRFNSIGNVLAIAGDDKKVRIYAFECMKLTLLHTFKHVDYVRCLEFHPYLPYLISGSDDQTIKIFNYQNGKKLETLNGHTSYVMDIKSSNNILYSVGMDTTLRVWTIPGFSMKRNSTEVSTCDILEAHYKGVTTLTINKNYLITGSDDCTIKIFDLLELPTYKMTLNYHNKPITSLILTKNYLISGGEDGKVIFFNQNFKFIKEINFQSRVWSLSVNEKERTLSIGTDEGLVVLDFDESRFNYNLFSMGYDSLLYIEDRNLKITDFLTATSLMELKQKVLKIKYYKNYILLKYIDKLIIYEISNDLLIENKKLKEIKIEKGDIDIIIENEDIYLINKTYQTIKKIKEKQQFDLQINNKFIIKNQIIQIIDNKLYLTKLNIKEDKLEINNILLFINELKNINLNKIIDIKIYKDDLIYIIFKDKILVFIKEMNEYILKNTIKCNIRSFVLIEFILFVSSDRELFAIFNDLIIPLKASNYDIIGYYFYNKSIKNIIKLETINNNKEESIKQFIEFISNDLKFYLIEYKELKLNKFVCNLKELAFKMSIKYEKMGFGEIINKIPISRFYGESIMNFMVENGKGINIIEQLNNSNNILKILINEYKITKNKNIQILLVSCLLKIYSNKLNIKDINIKPYLLFNNSDIDFTNLLNEFKLFNKMVNKKLFFLKESNLEANEAIKVFKIIKDDNPEDIIIDVLLNIMVVINASKENYNNILNHRLQSKTLEKLIKSFYNLSMQDLVFNIMNREFLIQIAILFKDRNILTFLISNTSDFSGISNVIENIGNRDFIKKHISCTFNELINEISNSKSIEQLNELSLTDKKKDIQEDIKTIPQEVDEEWEREVEAEFAEEELGNDEMSFESHEE